MFVLFYALYYWSLLKILKLPYDVDYFGFVLLKHVLGCYTGMFPVGDTSCRTLIDVCVGVCVCVCVCVSVYQSVRRHIAKLRQEWFNGLS